MAPEGNDHDIIITPAAHDDHYQQDDDEHHSLLLVSKVLGLLDDNNDDDDDDDDHYENSTSSSSSSSCFGPGRIHPRHANADWDSMLNLLLKKPHLAKLPCGNSGIYYPINLAVCNQVHPVPCQVVECLIQADPELLTTTTFELACSNLQLNLQVMETLLCHKSELLSHWSLRQIAFYDNAKLAEYIVKRYPSVLPKVCGDWSLIYGNSIQTFWLRTMLRCCCGSSESVISEDRVLETHLLHYMTSQSNLDAVKLLVGYYPNTLSVTRQGGRLPLHEALSNYKGRVYGWNSKLVLYLLEEGRKHHVGETYGGFGGLFVPDEEGNTPLESILHQIRYVSSFSNKDLLFGDERWNCLLQCIHFVHGSLGGDHDDSIVIKALSTIPFAPHVIDYMFEKYPVEDVSLLKNGKGQNCIQVVIEAITTKDSPIRKIANKYYILTKTLFTNLLGNRYEGGGEHLARIQDKCGRLPLVHAITAGLRWECGVSEILRCHPRALEEMDPVSGLYLFMVAAASDGSGGGGDLNASFELLRRYPNVAVCLQSVT